jgi:transcriptional regulator with XRE-family HTH domain
MNDSKANSKNNEEYETPLKKYRTAMGLSLIKLAKIIKTNSNSISDLEKRITSPYYEKKKQKHKFAETKAYATKLCNFFDVELTELFPEEIYNTPLYIATDIRSCYTDEQLIDFHSATTIIPDPETLLAQKKFKKEIHDHLNSLDRSLKLTIKMRYGFLNHDESILDKIAEKQRTNHEKVRQKECKALRILRHPMHLGRPRYREKINILEQDYTQINMDETSNEKLIHYETNKKFFTSINIDKLSYIIITNSDDWKKKIEWINENYAKSINQKKLTPSNAEELFKDKDWKYNVEWIKENYRDTESKPEIITYLLKEKTIKTLEENGFSPARILGILDTNDGISKISWIEKRYCSFSDKNHFIKKFNPWQVTSLMLGSRPFQRIDWLDQHYKRYNLTPQSAIDLLFKKYKETELKHCGKPPIQYQKNI